MAKEKQSVKQRVYNFIKRRPTAGATTDEIEVALDLPHQTISPRVNELMNEGVITYYGSRNTRRGRPAAVFFAFDNIFSDQFV